MKSAMIWRIARTNIFAAVVFEHVALQHYFPKIREVPWHLIFDSDRESYGGKYEIALQKAAHHAGAVLAIVTVYVNYLSWNPQVQQGDVLNEQSFSVATDLRRRVCGRSRQRANAAHTVQNRAVAAVALKLATVSSPRGPAYMAPQRTQKCL